MIENTSLLIDLWHYEMLMEISSVQVKNIEVISVKNVKDWVDHERESRISLGPNRVDQLLIFGHIHPSARTSFQHREERSQAILNQPEWLRHSFSPFSQRKVSFTISMFTISWQKKLLFDMLVFSHKRLLFSGDLTDRSIYLGREILGWMPFTPSLGENYRQPPPTPSSRGESADFCT